ncbi:MAG: ABC transporter substrate-binding protein, partial [Myxococcota bacterium]
SPIVAGAMKGDPQVKVLSAPSALYTYMGINHEDPVLSNVKVRRAIAHAINRDEIIKYKFDGMARPATGLLAPGHWAYEGDVERYEFNPGKAMALLDEAGFADPDGPGPQKRFTVTYKTSTNKFRLGVARAMASMLEAVGIGVKLRSYEFGTLFDDIRSGNFQLFTMQWNETVEPDLFRWIFHSKSIPASATGQGGSTGANRGRYRNPEMDALLDEGRVEPDVAKRRAIYQKVQKIAASDLPYISLWHEDNIVISAPGVSGYTIAPQAGFEGLTGVSCR